MPPRRATAPAASPLDEIRAWRERRETLTRQLQAELVETEGRVSEIKQALAELGGPASPPPVATTAKREPTVMRARVETSAPAVVEASDDPVAAELKQLAPWAGALEGNRRKAFDLRMGGMTAQDIAAKLNIDHKAAANAIFQGRARLRELKSRGAPKPAPATDSDEEPEPVSRSKPAVETSDRSMDPSFGGFSARCIRTENDDIAPSTHATRTKAGIKPPLIRRDDPTEHPVIVDVGGVEVLALDVGIGAERGTVLVRWWAGSDWAATTDIVARGSVLRDATACEIENGVDQAVA